jgi:hypothetical protein
MGDDGCRRVGDWSGRPEQTPGYPSVGTAGSKGAIGSGFDERLWAHAD